MGTPPSPTARGTPADFKPQDGFKTTVTIAGFLTLSIWEKGVKPPGIDGGEAVDTTTMLNTTYRSFSPRNLKTLTPIMVRAAWRASAYLSLVAAININTTITVTFPDGGTLAFYGFLKGFEPGELVEGTQPEGTLTIVPTNLDHSDQSEQAPVYTAGTGTDY